MSMNFPITEFGLLPPIPIPPERRKPGVDYLGLAYKIAERRKHPTSTLRQWTREQYVQFCNVCAAAFTELDPDFNARTFQEACQVVGEENAPYVGKPLLVKSWEAAVRIAEGHAAIDGQRRPVLIQIGKNAAKVFPQWNRGAS